MFDPLGNPFSDDNTTLAPPWPTTPHSPFDPIPNLPRPSSRPVTPQPSGTPDLNKPAPVNTGLYGREPQIYGQPEPGLISPRANTGSNGTKFEKLEPYLRVRITGLERNRRDILVKFDAQTNLSNFTGTTYRNVSRSYYEFQQFYEAIIQNNPQTIVPALPLAQTSAPTDEEDDRLVKIMLQRWLGRICEDPILIAEEEVRSFVESDFGYQPAPVTRRKTSSGFSLIRRGVPDEDETLQKARFELTKLETQFFDAAKAIDKLSKTRRTLAGVRAEMGNKFVNVATTEAHPPLGNAFRKIGRAYHSLSDLDQAQAISECLIIGDSLGYQGLNARSAKETLQQRTGVLEEYQAAVKTTISKRRNIERLRASSNIRAVRVDEAIEEMEEANRYEQILSRRAEGISQNLHQALERHNKLVTDDVVSALIEHVRSSIMYERQHLRELEALRADVSSAANKVAPAKPGSAPKPKYIPPLEDFSRPPPIPRPASIPPGTSARASPAPGPPHPQPQPPSVLAQAHSADPLGSSSPAGPPAIANPTPIIRPTPLSTKPSPALPPSGSRTGISGGGLQSPGAGPSSPIVRTASAASTSTSSHGHGHADGGPPLGGRFVDGTKSMFVKPSGSGSGLGMQHGSSSTPTTPSRKMSFQSPLHVPSGGAGSSSSAQPQPHPLAGGGPLVDPLLGGGSRANGSGNGAVSSGQSAGVREELDPLGMAKPSYMSASVRVQPTRPRLDAREAASKLANMF